jgi:hypothetical protein
MAAVTVDASPAMGPDVRGPVPARTGRLATADRSPATVRPGRTVRSWPLLVLAAPAAAEVWSGWVGIAQKTGFGLVSPLPGIWPSLHLDTSITLPVGVEAYAAYALRAWLASEQTVSARTRRFAKWSAIFSFALGMAGQIAYHLLAQAGAARAPWPITTIVSCLPVLVLAMGTTLAHMLRADAATADTPGDEAAGPGAAWSPHWSRTDQHAGQPDQDQAAATTARSSHPPGTSEHLMGPSPAAPSSIGHGVVAPAHPQKEQALRVARELADAGRPVSRRALRSSGIKGSNEALNALARMINAEFHNQSASRAAALHCPATRLAYGITAENLMYTPVGEQAR